jgi:hypothetical protein
MSYIAWQPGEEKGLGFFVPHGKLGLTLVSDDPKPDFAVFDWTAELDPLDPLDIELPYFESFELSIYAAAGSAQVFIGSGAAFISIGAGESHVSTYTYARCPRLRLFSEESALIRVKLEEKNTKNMIRRRVF